MPRLPTIQAELVVHPLFPDFWRKPRPTQLHRLVLPERSSQGRARRWERQTATTGPTGRVPGVRAEFSACWAHSRLRSRSPSSISRARVTRLLKEESRSQPLSVTRVWNSKVYSATPYRAPVRCCAAARLHQPCGRMVECFLEFVSTQLEVG